MAKVRQDILLSIKQQKALHELLGSGHASPPYPSGAVSAAGATQQQIDERKLLKNVGAVRAELVEGLGFTEEQAVSALLACLTCEIPVLLDWLCLHLPHADLVPAFRGHLHPEDATGGSSASNSPLKSPEVILPMDDCADRVRRVDDCIEEDGDAKSIPERARADQAKGGGGGGGEEEEEEADAARRKAWILHRAEQQRAEEEAVTRKEVSAISRADDSGLASMTLEQRVTSLEIALTEAQERARKEEEAITGGGIVWKDCLLEESRPSSGKKGGKKGGANGGYGKKHRSKAPKSDLQMEVEILERKLGMARGDLKRARRGVGNGQGSGNTTAELVEPVEVDALSSEQATGGSLKTVDPEVEADEDLGSLMGTLWAEEEYPDEVASDASASQKDEGAIATASVESSNGPEHMNLAETNHAPVQSKVEDKVATALSQQQTQWTGKSPKRLLEEWCQKHRYPRPLFKKSPRGGSACTCTVQIRDNSSKKGKGKKNKKSASNNSPRTDCLTVSAPVNTITCSGLHNPKDDADLQAAATRALFELNRNKPM